MIDTEQSLKDEMLLIVENSVVAYMHCLSKTPQVVFDKKNIFLLFF